MKYGHKESGFEKYTFKEKEVRVSLEEEISRMESYLHREYRYPRDVIENHCSGNTLIENAHSYLYCSIHKEIESLWNVYEGGIYDDYDFYSNRLAYAYCRARLHILSYLTLYRDELSDKCIVDYVETEDEVIATVRPTKKAIGHAEDLIRRLTDKVQFSKDIFKKIPTKIRMQKTIKKMER
ncbi:MAG: hypothetical protein ACRDDY_03565 [Clostridium sp.]|uniref:hypothetical protein n=1 Tax=Clostridium sp. TaxID=1506 RepID=UPI003EE4D2AA